MVGIKDKLKIEILEHNNEVSIRFDDRIQIISNLASSNINS